MRKMNEQEIRDFLSEGTRTAKVAWVAKDGAPHVTPVWFILDGDDIVFSTSGERGKGKALARDGRASVVVDLETPPFAVVKIDGTVSIETDLAKVREVSALVGGRYMGADRADEMGERNGVPGHVVVRITPTKINAMADLAE